MVAGRVDQKSEKYNVGSKRQPKNEKILLNLDSLKPEVYNAICWSGKYNMLKKLVRIFEDLKKAAEDQNVTLALQNVDFSIGNFN